MTSEQFLLIAGIWIVSVLLFVCAREFFCWYFKINLMNNTLREILEELRKRNEG